MGSSWGRVAHICLLPACVVSQGKPIVINLGPLMDISELAQRDSNPLEVFEDNEELFRGLMDHFGGHMLPAMESGARGFQTEVKGDHFKLRGSLPGYSMHRSSDGDEPLNVQVAGRTLVVQGTKSSGNMMSSFQRSFPLPWEPDPEQVAVTYSAQDGALLVDVARKSGAAEPMEQALAPQMTMSFSDLGRRDPRLRGFRGLPMIVGLRVRDNFQDPFEQFWNDLQASGELVDVAESAESTTKSAPRPEHAPVVVQPKNATPFWRLSGADQNQFIDIVSPPGVKLGKVQGSLMEYAFNDGKPQRLELPVAVRQEDCMQNQMSSQEHVLRCHATVRNLRINVIDEL